MPILPYILLTGILQLSYCQEDSLQSALNAINRRQRDLSVYDDNEYGYTLERPDDPALSKSPTYNLDHSYAISQPITNYVEEDKYNQDFDKRLSSAFRERVEEDDQRQLEEIAHNLISNVERKGRYNLENEDYEELLREFWDKHRRPYETSKSFSKIDKRAYFHRFGLDTKFGLKKRDIFENKGHDLNDRGSDKELTDDDDEYPFSNINKHYNQGSDFYNKPEDQIHHYSPWNHFPVTKRSSDYSKEVSNENKMLRINKQTDPNVEKELNDIFGGKISQTTTTVKATVTPLTTTTRGNTLQISTTNIPKGKEQVGKEYPKIVNERPLQIKKKSIDWSDYFGLDRRKKSSHSDNLDKEWLIERYHKSIAMASKKRNTDLPTKSLPTYNDLDDNANQKIDEMDNKLKILEDKIVDDALKYTGARQGETSLKKIQDTKDAVISRLAAAYNLEKMRNALSEYRLLVTQSKKPEKDYVFLEEKRTSVPRKSVVDNDRVGTLDADNNIKCSDGADDCHEQNYKTPTEILESYLGTEECPIVERACNEVASIIGVYGHIFRTACNMYQMCLLCSNNSWFPPTRQCNALFVAKTYDLCESNIQCQQEAQHAVKYLLDLNRNLHSQPTALNECELSCPYIEAIFDPNSR